MVDEFKRADLGGYVQLEGPLDSVTHPRREMDGDYTVKCFMSSYHM